MKNYLKKALAVTLALAMLCVTLCGCEKKTDETQVAYPERKIELVIPFSEGGASDITARQFAASLEKVLGQSITCVNKASGGTVEGFEYALAQESDGYTLFWLTNSVLMKEAQNAASAKFTETFEPLLLVAADLTIIMVKDDSPFQTMEELVAYAKDHPGELTIAGTSPGGFDDYQMTSVAEELGIDITYVPYSGGSEVKAAVLGNEVDIYQDKIASCLSLMQSGDVRPLAVIADEPITAVPELNGVPTLKQLGADFAVGPRRGLSVEADIDPQIMDILKKACVEAYNSAEFQEYLQTNYLNIRPATEQSLLKETWINEVESYKPFYIERGLI